MRKLYVGNLSFAVDSSALAQMFAEYGNVESATVVSDRETGRSRGFGFIEMSNGDEAQAAIEALNGREHGGRTLTVNDAKPREERPREDRPRGNRFGGGHARRY